MELHLRTWSGDEEAKTVALTVDDFNHGPLAAEQTVGWLHLVRLQDTGNVGWCYGEHGGVEPTIMAAVKQAVLEIEWATGGVVTTGIPQMHGGVPEENGGVDDKGLWVYLGAR